jgi:hypothetical protein
MCNEPVTFGGGMTMQYGLALGSRDRARSGAKAPDASHA